MLIRSVLGYNALMKRFLTDTSRAFEAKTLHPHVALGNPEMRLVKMYPGVTYQHIIGFGAALTEASGYVFAHMSPETQAEFLDLCFGEDGNRYSLCRLSIQSCDFSLAPRTYMGKRDTSLASFSIDDDWAYVLPLVKAAQTRNPALQFLATPWSPPAWAKTNFTMKYGGHLKRESYDIWARMIAETLLAYRAEGIPIDRITVQNEPQARQKWESCLFNAAQERSFLHDALKPALSKAGLDHVKVLVWDHNKESVLDRTAAYIIDDTYAADLDGVAFHWYSGDHFEALRATREIIGSDRELIFTEGCDFYSEGSTWWELPHAEHYAHEIIGDLEAGANGIIDWNILLDSAGGPNHVGNYCDAPIMYDITEQRMNVRLPFRYIGHFSRFVQPGARRILTTRYTTDLETCGFANPDGTYALVALNRTDSSIDFDLAWPGKTIGMRIAHVDAPPHSIQTICW